MANDEHVAMLKKGVDAWNEWRKEGVEGFPRIHVRPDCALKNRTVAAPRTMIGRDAQED